ncbi:methyl-accepting chemotaxis protein [Lederbergia lenta]|uniref:Methyl-accepting chemotaxis sensory transducer with Cache sensor n=1 Tax=Lederbergia lenta TaxID=1467 RepID=A0A2X4WCR1_LEDLE|nr:methyl-accepting chemotaxis protein [Lederbergia lenta]MEC2322847.1 methyl-accepting chemotaxis protein [Lederbergia lenta]SQI61916.1 methyl-accepting chemotaxis sensory transducer with Cache sensor [Lederbergia lenta]
MKTIKIKIISGFVVVISLVMIMGVINFISTQITNQKAAIVVDDELPLLNLYEAINFNMNERTSLARGYLLYDQKAYYNAFTSATDDIRVLEKQLIALSPHKSTQELVDRVHAWEQLMDKQVFSQYDNEDKERAIDNFRKIVEPVGLQLRTTLNELATTRVENISTSGEDIIKSGSRAAIISIGLTVGIIVIGIAVALFIANSLSRPIVRVVKRMKSIADGDLTHEDLKTRSKDEVGVLIHAVNDMNKQIREMAVEIGTASKKVTNRSKGLSQSAMEVNISSEQVAVTMKELALASESEAQSAAQLVDSMGLLSDNIHDANEHGRQANLVTDEVLEFIVKGNTAMNESVSMMKVIDENVKVAVKKVGKLDKHSNEISQLVNVISDIAEQTNLLALNAAIEAARAGEFGKGFAVVADEVKKLAEQVAKSVSNITGIVSTIQIETNDVVDSLHDSFEHVELGTKQIEATGLAFESISQAVHQVVKQIQIISADLTEIAGNSEIMNHSIANIAAITEEASAGIEETAASASETTNSMNKIVENVESLSEVAVNLDHLIRRFKVS